MEAPGRSLSAGAPPILHLGGDEEGPFDVDANVIATGRTCVIGASGSGKSYAVGVICEELCKSGVPFALVDTEGEHSGLKEKYDMLLVGDGQGCDLRWSSLDLSDLGRQAPDLAPLILDLSETDEPRQKVSDLLSSVYAEVEKRRTPYLIVVEEADRFVPQNGERVAIFGEIARRGRKRGVGLMVCTQRPSLVDKNILSQCGNQLIGKLVIRNDLQAVSQFFHGRDLPKELTALSAGRFYAMGGLSPRPRLVTIREKETHYRGGTPRIVPRVVRAFRPSGVAPWRDGFGIRPRWARPGAIPRRVQPHVRARGHPLHGQARQGVHLLRRQGDRRQRSAGPPADGRARRRRQDRGPQEEGRAEVPPARRADGQVRRALGRSRRPATGCRA